MNTIEKGTNEPSVQSSEKAPGPIRVLVADRHMAACSGLACYLAHQPDLHVVAACSSVKCIQRHLRQEVVHVVLLGESLAGDRSLREWKRLRAQFPKTCLLFMSVSLQEEHIKRALTIRANGLVLKDIDLSEFPRAIRALASGGTHFSREVCDRLLVHREGLRLANNA